MVKHIKADSKCKNVRLGFNEEDNKQYMSLMHRLFGWKGLMLPNKADGSVRDFAIVLAEKSEFLLSLCDEQDTDCPVLPFGDSETDMPINSESSSLGSGNATEDDLKRALAARSRR